MNYTEEFAICLDKSNIDYDVQIGEVNETFSIFEIDSTNYKDYKITVSISKKTIGFTFRKLAKIDVKNAKQLLETMRTLNDLNMRAATFKWSLGRTGDVSVTHSMVKQFQSPEELTTFLTKMLQELFSVYVPALRERIYNV